MFVYIKSKYLVIAILFGLFRVVGRVKDCPSRGSKAMVEGSNGHIGNEITQVAVWRVLIVSLLRVELKIKSDNFYFVCFLNLSNRNME